MSVFIRMLLSGLRVCGHVGGCKHAPAWSGGLQAGS